MTTEIAQAIRLMESLPPEKMHIAIEFIQSLNLDSRETRALRKANRRKLAGSISDEDYQRMMVAIDEAFEQVEEPMWT